MTAARDADRAARAAADHAAGGGRRPRARRRYRSVIGEPGEGVPLEARGGGPGPRPHGAPGAPGTPPAAGAGAGAATRRAGAPPAGAGAHQAGGGAPTGQGTPPAGGAAARRPAAAPGRGGGRRADAATQGPGIPGARGDGGGGGLGRRPASSTRVERRHAPRAGSAVRQGHPAAGGVPAGQRAVVGYHRNQHDALRDDESGCNGAPNGVWAIDLDSEAKPVVSWKDERRQRDRRRDVFDGWGDGVRRGRLRNRAASSPRDETGSQHGGRVGQLSERDRRARCEDARSEGLVTRSSTAEFTTAPMVFKFNDERHGRCCDEGCRASDRAGRGVARRRQSRDAELRLARPLLTAGSTSRPTRSPCATEAIPAPPSAQPTPGDRLQPAQRQVRPAHRRLLPHGVSARARRMCSCRSPAIVAAKKSETVFGEWLDHQWQHRRGLKENRRHRRLAFARAGVGVARHHVAARADRRERRRVHRVSRQVGRVVYAFNAKDGKEAAGTAARR